MFNAFQTFGRMGGAASRPWSERALWPLGASSPGLWIDGPSYPAACWQDSAGTTALSTVGTVLDSSNPVGLILDRKGGLVLGPELVAAPYSGIATGGFAISATSVTRDGVTAAGAVGVSTTSASGLVLVEFDVSGLSGDTFTMLKAGGNVGEITSNGHKRFRVIRPNPAELRFVPWVGGAGSLTITNISVREIPGLHLSQSTSAARPVASGRVNLLISTEDLTNASAWPRSGGAATPNASTVTFGATGDYIYQTATGVTANMPTASRLLLSGSGTITINFFDAGGAAETQLTLTGTPTWYTLTRTASGSAIDLSIQIIKRAGDTAASVTCGGIQMNLGPTALPYQRVNTASDYTAVPPTYLKFDGTDDALASATVAAGVVGNSDMTCLMAVRRDSTANCVAGLYNSVADATKFFGMCESGSGSTCVGSGAGTPTVWVDGVQLTGGTAVTRATLHTALTAGAWHILEFRGLDLSRWTACGFGVYTSYVLNGALGGIELFAASSASDRDKARTKLAAKVGLTL